MSKRTRRTFELVLLALLILFLLGRLPSYSYVRVTAENGTTVIEQTGPGPHRIHVEGPDGSFARSGSW
jgi:hypothetical protein